MPPRQRRPAGDDDFAPGGSEVTRQGPERPEILPPGRRNQKNPTPPVGRVRGSGQARGQLIKAEDVLPPEPPPAEALAEALTRVQSTAPARRGGRLAPVEPDPEPEYDDEPQVVAGVDLGEVFMPSTAVSDEATVEEKFELMAQALMYGMRLCLLGEGQVGDWDTFEQLARNALMYGEPDPLEECSSTQRFLFGLTGWERTDGFSSAEDIADIINLGQPE